MPHARVIAVESEREFGLSVLQRLDAELSKRGELYRTAGVNDLAAYREYAAKHPEVPHLALGLFGIIFAYFTNAPAVRALAGSKDDPFSPRALALQRRFLEKAVYRLLGPRPRSAGRRGRPRP